jgi:ribokinase
MNPSIVVIGSINMDIVNHVESFPEPGETITGLGTEYSSGGKGANQAVAASLAGGDVMMIGAVGDDPFSDALKASLSNYGVDTSQVLKKSGSSGLAFITVNNKGQNHIVLSEGANAQVSSADIEAGLIELIDIKVMLFQNEIPWDTTEVAVNWAQTQGIKVYYNPAPARKIPQTVLPLMDTIILNEMETLCITGITISNIIEAEKAADALLQSGVKAVIITLGEKGSMYKNGDGKCVITPAFKVEPLDTTAAGDTFIGAFTVAQTEGLDIESSLSFASAAAALSVSRKGAQASIPRRQEIDDFINAQRL